jgi:hypothetical protein
MPAEKARTGQFLETPVLEMFERYRDGAPDVFVRAIRCGPDRLHPSTFDDCPWPLNWVLYWYRVHTWCADAVCRCKSNPRYGDGVCVAAFKNGMYGYYSLVPYYDGTNAIRWGGAANERCLTGEELSRLEEQCLLAGGDSVPCDDAVEAVWRTLRSFNSGESNSKPGEPIPVSVWSFPEPIAKASIEEDSVTEASGADTKR